VSNGRPRLSTALLILAALAQAPSARAAGFHIFEQGSKAMGMAGAFTAQADDPSALFHNVGGLAFLHQRQVSVGATLVTSHDEKFVGAAPGSGTGANGSLSSLSEPLPHVYWIQPINDNWSFGLGLTAPFGLKTEWEDPDNFAGRYLSTKGAMRTLDLSPGVGVKLSDKFGVGFGLIARFSEVELGRRVPSFDPASGRVVDVAAFSLESEVDQGLGWQAGLLHKYNDSFSWGFTYRSNVKIDYAGDARLRQITSGNPQLDELIAASLPLDQALRAETAIEFPDTASLGLLVAVSRNSRVELDVNWAGWSTFDTLTLQLPDFPALSSSQVENWKDVFQYRLGLRSGRAGGSEWRCGVVVDESPQPDAAVSPLLPDADRTGYTAGWGRRPGRRGVDLAVMYLDFVDRSTNGVNRDDFNGVYSQTGWLFSATLTF